ncbi:methyltransferase domain-containing protein [Rhodovulum sp. PH10]|uniref:methyltransferase domain-containing protein n=1 Tax=Rhodovulum sp. PH10 TaxID=1187851 RepID=UPI0009FF6348
MVSKKRRSEVSGRLLVDECRPATPLGRSESILTNIDTQKSKILEIGPLYRPLVKKGGGNVFYADHCSADELVEKYKDDPLVSAHALADIDFVVERDIGEACKNAAPFDVVVASHVIEHVPDLVGWMMSIHTLLRAGGILCLAVPDKRFTFDVLRRSTTMKDIREAHEEKRSRPPLDIVCDSYRNSVGFEPGSIWNAPLDLERCAVGWPSSVVNGKIALHMKGCYVDVHCSVFTPWEFLKIVSSIVRDYKIEFSVRYFRNTIRGEEEFHVQMVKGEAGTDWDSLVNEAESNAVWPDYLPPSLLRRGMALGRGGSRCSIRPA